MAEPRDLEELDPTALAGHEAWEAEKQWPLFRVVILGDDVEWDPRPDERFWEPKEYNVKGRPVTAWEPIDGKPVIRQARAVVSVRAVNEEVARSRALSSNGGYHTIESCEEIPE